MRPFLLCVFLLFIATVSAKPPPSANRRGHHYPNRVNTRKYFGWVPKSKTSSSVNLTELAEEFLHTHNWVRRQYKLPLYVWNEKLAGYARAYLRKRYEDCKLIHSNSNYGENMFWGKKLHWTASDATYYWYIEREWYDFKTLHCSPSPKACGHFTQIVWRDSTSLGCALQHCHNPGTGMLMACEYDPPGNYENENPLQHHT